MYNIRIVYKISIDILTFCDCMAFGALPVFCSL